MGEKQRILGCGWLWGKKLQLSEARQRRENNDKDAGDDRENNRTSDESGEKVTLSAELLIGIC